ncbi:hypothetical protein EV192_102553 [Actinocrispum wychmicini]|uniref:Uncharacterized protein n=1 Tax=Actinocrispum wychmicini TaxID=1213861 RepID=A0A4R2K7T1_9PSEU|nr:hypothetical protein EV192_102553 [Actinocrispum wychmicini]
MRFAVHGPAQWLEGSPRCHRPSGGDVASGVNVSMTSKPTGDALEYRLALAVAQRGVPTSRTLLRRVRGADLLDSAGRFVLQAGLKLPPAVGEDAPVDSRLLPDVAARLVGGPLRGAGHSSNIQVLYPDQIEPTGQVGRGLLHPVLTPIALTSSKNRDGSLDSCAPARTASATSKPTLQTLNASLFFWFQPGRLQEFAGGESGRDCDAPVHPDRPSVAGSGDRLRDHCESYVPPAGPVSSDPVGLCHDRHSARPLETNPPHLRHPQPSVPTVEPLNMLAFQANLSKSLIPANFAPRRCTTVAFEEATHSLGKVPQRLLLHGHAARSQPRKLRTRLGQLTGLLVIARRRGTTRCPMPVLLACEVPDKPGLGAVLQQTNFLVRRWGHAVTRHKMNASRQHGQDRIHLTTTKVMGLISVPDAGDPFDWKSQ